MIHTISTYRRLFASLMAMWMSLIVVSGIVFMHKEVTSKGEIVTHIHPYDFTKKGSKHHHKSDAEIQFLNVLHFGNFVQTDFIQYEEPVLQEFSIQNSYLYVAHYHATDILHSFLRGPPQFS